MPEAIYGNAILSQIILPPVIIIASIIVIAAAEDAYLGYPFLTFQCIVQAGILVTFLLDFRESFRAEYDHLVQ